MNIALICHNVIRVSQILDKYYSAQGDCVYHFLFTRRRHLDYPVEGNVIYVKERGIRRTGIVEFSGSVYRIAKELRVLKNKYDIDVAISFMEISNLFNILSKRRERCILSVRTTLSLRNEFIGYEYNKILIYILYNRADFVVAAGEYSREDLRKNYHLKREKILAIPNPAIQYKSASTDKWLYGDKVVISVTRFDGVKQVDRIIRAFSSLYEKENSSKLLLIGDGKERDYLKHMASKYKISEAVIFMGYKEDIGWFLENSRVFVMASRVEGFPNAMVEAMSYGVPIISTDTPGSCGEIIGDEIELREGVSLCEYGILTPYMPTRASKEKIELDSEEIILGRAMEMVICDDKVYEKYSKKSLQRSKKYEFNNVMNQWNDIVKGGY